MAIEWIKRKRYVYAMMKAIDHAATHHMEDGDKSSRTDGLRVIKRFERVRETEFNPFNRRDVWSISKMASFERFHIRARKLLGSQS